MRVDHLARKAPQPAVAVVATLLEPDADVKEPTRPMRKAGKETTGAEMAGRRGS